MALWAYSLLRLILAAYDFLLKLLLNSSEEIEARLPKGVVEIKLMKTLPKFRFAIVPERPVLPCSWAFLAFSR